MISGYRVSGIGYRVERNRETSNRFFFLPDTRAPIPDTPLADLIDQTDQIDKIDQRDPKG